MSKSKGILKYCKGCNRQILIMANDLCKNCYLKDWRQKYPLYTKEYHNKYPELKKLRNKMNKLWHKQHPNYLKIWVKNHPNYRKIWNKNHPKERLIAEQKCIHKNLESWVGIISRERKCQICGKAIYFNLKYPNNAIHFDHKKMNLPIKGSPVQWLKCHRYNSKNKIIWDNCNFGLLCKRCNLSLPTKNRKIWFKKAYRYVFQKKDK